MVAYSVPKRLKLALTPTIAIAVGLFVALWCMLAPSDVLDVIMLDSGVPALLPAAEPPLGWTARTALAMILGGGAGAIAWLAGFLLLGGDGVVTVAAALPPLPNMPQRATAAPVMKTDDTPVPVLRRADAHPDAPARAPLLATRDLGTPFLEVCMPKRRPVERNLPRDLDAPLSAFDPQAIPAVPAEPVRAVAPLRAVPNPANHDRGERFEAFELRRPAASPAIAAPLTDATIHALLDRLERGVSARVSAEARSGGIDDTLNELRRMATR